MAKFIDIKIEWHRVPLQCDLFGVPPIPAQARCRVPLAIRPWLITMSAPAISWTHEPATAREAHTLLALVGARPMLARETADPGAFWRAPAERMREMAAWAARVTTVEGGSIGAALHLPF